MPTGVDTPPSRRAALQVRDLRVSYGTTIAVDGIALDVEEGEIFGLLGPNGAGKTSALSAIEGLVRPDEGSIIVVDVDALPSPRWRSEPTPGRFPRQAALRRALAGPTARSIFIAVPADKIAIRS
jgi:ABC-type lipopolysaccharide export system ATPase subunit